MNEMQKLAFEAGFQTKMAVTLGEKWKDYLTGGGLGLAGGTATGLAGRGLYNLVSGEEGGYLPAALAGGGVGATLGVGATHAGRKFMGQQLDRRLKEHMDAQGGPLSGMDPVVRKVVQKIMNQDPGNRQGMVSTLLNQGNKGKGRLSPFLQEAIAGRSGAELGK